MAGIGPLLCVVAAVAPLAACSYDWNVERTAPGADAEADVMTQPDVGGPDASESGGPDSSGVDSGTAPQDTGGPPASDGAPSCAQLTQQLLQARAADMACTETVSACMTTVKDECGCDVVVGGDPGNEAAFASALAAFKQASCSVTSPTMLCPGTCPTIGTTHPCLAQAQDGGTVYSCYQ
jgi:hypothetical protein